MAEFIEMVFSRIDNIFDWCRSSKTFSQNIFRGLIALLALFLILFILSVYGVVLLLVPRISTFLIAGLLCLFLWSIISTFILKKVKQTVWRRASFCSGLLFITFLSLFLSGFIFGFIPPIAGRYIFPGKIKLPLGDTDGMAVDSLGNIYLAVPFYQRIQVYNSEGLFLKGLHVDARIGAFYIWIEDKLLHVAISRTNKHIAMNSDGHVLEKSEIQSFEEWESLWNKASVNKHKDDSGNIYQFQDSKWFPKIRKTELSGNTIVLISDTIHFWLLKGPFPAWLLGLFSMLMILFVKLRKLKYKYLVDLEIKSEPSPELDLGE